MKKNSTKAPQQIWSAFHLLNMCFISLIMATFYFFVNSEASLGN